MTREKMIEECVTPNEDVSEMCEQHFEKGYNAGWEDCTREFVNTLKHRWSKLIGEFDEDLKTLEKEHNNE